MKILVFSDSHGSPFSMLMSIKASKPEMIIHLGDGGRDLDKIKEQFPQIPLKAVRGNCDLSSTLPETELLTVNGIKIFFTHGHLYGVKHELSALLRAAMDSDADLVMFGHTHVAYVNQYDKIRVLNPGSCGHSTARSYIELIISDDGNIYNRIIAL